MKETLFTRYFWLLAIGVTVLNALFLKFRSWKHIQERPELAKGYERLIKGVLFWGNLPWLVMGFGILCGFVPGLFAYFRPREGNPLVLAWFATVVGLWFLGFRWLFAQKGAEFLVEHPGLMRRTPRNPDKIRRLYGLMVAAGVIGLLILFSTKVPQLPH